MKDQAVGETIERLLTLTWSMKRLTSSHVLEYANKGRDGAVQGAREEFFLSSDQ